MENVLRPLTVLGGSVLLTLAVGWAADLLLRRADLRHPEIPLWGLLRRCRLPLQVVLLTTMLRGSFRETGWRIFETYHTTIGRALSLVLTGAGAWLVVRIVSAVVESAYARYASSTRDAARVRRVRTQVTLIMRIVTAVVVVVAVAAILLTFPDMRAVGTSMLASAGIIGIVAGVAAQSTLGNLFAGFQIAFGDMVRIGDTVVVDGEWGVVEEVTLTFLTVRTWDERRITMPVSYFTSKPFENWSRGGIQMTGTVFFQLDHSAPVPLMREKLHAILLECPAWDGRDWNLAVTDTTPSTMEVRAVVTAKDANDIWTVRCAVREAMLAWLAEHHAYALPRIGMAPAAILPAQSRGEPEPEAAPEPERSDRHPSGAGTREDTGRPGTDRD
ncbi:MULTISPECIES: mechanosensitive ion channel domain-containing protein [unclassified Streptomyces]|uniref:mechanosensitive ion channel family protein n=1 Tax=unclassified Streptomyces TaxID=2593676 RepID=UPI00081E4B9C|nr:MULTISPECIES: mechanosensitive ion channel domain-containing protein [unclassified Streptomyces]MYZ33831.1 mechanosensitive ion channel [Streptomyces sp. SID4917]SCF62089.1 Small-conductance mechanosensitive channel [Streptomyces sp. MnatMP-M17]